MFMSPNWQRNNRMPERDQPNQLNSQIRFECRRMKAQTNWPSTVRTAEQKVADLDHEFALVLIANDNQSFVYSRTFHFRWHAQPRGPNLTRKQRALGGLWSGSKAQLSSQFGQCQCYNSQIGCSPRNHFSVESHVFWCSICRCVLCKKKLSFVRRHRRMAAQLTRLTTNVTKYRINLFLKKRCVVDQV